MADSPAEEQIADSIGTLDLGLADSALVPTLRPEIRPMHCLMPRLSESFARNHFAGRLALLASAADASRRISERHHREHLVFGGQVDQFANFLQSPESGPFGPDSVGPFYQHHVLDSATSVRDTELRALLNADDVGKLRLRNIPVRF